MALTPSTMLPLGTPAREFELPEVRTGERISLKNFSEKQALLVLFICAHCPYVVHVRDELARIGLDYASAGLGVVAISSNNAEAYPDDAPEKLAEMAEKLSLNFPLCHDETQEVAKAYTAACTPDIFLFDAQRKLAYRGQLDESRPGNGVPVTGRNLRSAIDAVLAGKQVDPDQKPSVGCNIKWKPGNQPNYS
jgi:peroxiredoxin